VDDQTCDTCKVIMQTRFVLCLESNSTNIKGSTKEKGTSLVVSTFQKV